VARTPRLDPEFLAQRSALGIVPGSAATRAVGAVISVLCAEELPGPGDASIIMDPKNARGVSSLVHIRRVGGRNLWVWYRERDGFLDLVALTDQPPG
jgi:hypothetical protein